MSENGFEARYRSGDTPWDHGMVDRNLVDIIDRYRIPGGRALDIGCGSGENALWLAQQGFNVVACDLSATAIRRAEEKGAAAGTDVLFMEADFLIDAIPNAPFGFVFDRGCLHCMDTQDERERFAEKVRTLLEEGGFWLSLVGNADEGEREVGPPQLTAAELAAIVEPRFEILLLSSGHFGSDQEQPPRAWICLMRRRAG